MTEDALAALIADYRDDPGRLATEFLGITPREFQPAILDLIAEHPRVAVAAARNVGKTTAAAIVALWFLITRPGSGVLVVCPTWAQLAYFMETVARIWRAAPARLMLPAWSVLASEVRTSLPGWKLQGISAESGPDWTEGFHGSTAVLVVADESKAIPDAIFASAFQVLGGHEEARVLAISTPSAPRGKFFSFFTDARWRTLKISARDVPRLRPHYEEQLAEHGPDSPFFKAQLEGEFCDVGETDAVFDFESLRRAVKRGRFEPALQEVSAWSRMIAPPPSYSRVLGCDVAGRGADSTIGCLKVGPNLGPIYDLGSGRDEMETCGRIVRLADQLRVCRVVVDAVGLGGPMASRLREVFGGRRFAREVEVESFIASARADNPENFQNKKTELAWRLKERLRAGTVTLPDDQGLISELAAYTATVDSRGRLRLVDPPKSPDRGDALLASLLEPAVSVRTVRAKGL